MTTAIEKHIAAIRAGKVTKTNVIGLRKAFNAAERASFGYSTGLTVPATGEEQALILETLLPEFKPIVTGDLHDSGKALLQSKRYRKQLASVADIVADITCFRLVGYDFEGNRVMHAFPVYRAYDSKGRSFPFRVIPWQSGGNGPEILSGNYW
jgi:hypothetical protein